MAATHHPNTSSANDREGEAVEAIEEHIAEYGASGTLAACLRSSAGEEFSKLGGNATLRIAQVIIREIAYSQNPRLEAEIMALGAGIILSDNATMTKIALKWGITKQALSKRVVAYCDENKLPPSAFMRSEKDRRTYAMTNQPRSA
jgi:hypothetical protein